MNTGKLLAAAYGWGPGSTDWPYLETGWQEESGWSTTAANDASDPYNHAYGIPQANPGTKMAAAGPDWKTERDHADNVGPVLHQGHLRGAVQGTRVDPERARRRVRGLLREQMMSDEWRMVVLMAGLAAAGLLILAAAAQLAVQADRADTATNLAEVAAWQVSQVLEDVRQDHPGSGRGRAACPRGAGEP